MNEMSTHEIYAKGYADGYENGRMSKERVFFPPCEDCNKKMDEVRKAYDYWKARKSDSISELEKIKAEIEDMGWDIYKTERKVPHKYVEKEKIYELLDNHIKELKGE